MNDITVKKDELRAKVVANRDAHRAIFEEAVEGYRKQALALLGDHIEAVKSGRVVRIAINLPYPEDHTADYDRVLAMLDMMIGDALLVNEDTFASYVMDDWGWKRQFLTANSAYSKTAAASL